MQVGCSLRLPLRGTEGGILTEGNFTHKYGLDLPFVSLRANWFPSYHFLIGLYLGLAEQDSFHLHPTQVSKPKQSEKMQKENTQSPLQIHDQKLKGDDGQTGFGATRPNAT